MSAELIAELHKLRSTPGVESKLDVIRRVAGKSCDICYETTMNGRSRRLGRVILRAPHDRKKQSRRTRLCAGLIIDGHNGAILGVSAPHRALVSQPPHSCDDPTKYTICDIHDGTLVVVYWHAPAREWRIGSSRAYDVGNYRWIGTLTYMEILTSILSRYSSFDWDNLCRDHSYVIGFRYGEHHPYAGDPECAWLVQVTHNASLSPATHEIGIPTQIPVTVTREQMTTKNIRALDIARKGGSPHYGYLITSVSDPTDVMVYESTLLRWMREVIYDLPPHTKCGYALTPETRVSYAILRGYLHPQSRAIVLSMFPSCGQYYAEYDAFFEKLVTEVQHELECRGIPGDESESTPPRFTPTIGITRVLAAQIGGDHSRATIRDHIVSITNLDTLYRYMHEHK